MKLKVYTDSTRLYRAILENFGGHIASMLFSSYNELIAFIVEMPIDIVTILEDKQYTAPYGYRLNAETISSSIVFYQLGKKGRKRSIEVGNE